MKHSKTNLMVIPMAAFVGLNVVACASTAEADGVAVRAVAQPRKVVGSSCQSGDRDHLCLALKYVAYKNRSDEPVVDQKEAENNVQGINQLWNQCNIAFQIESYVAASPRDYGLSPDPSDTSELTDIRNDFMDRSTLLVVTTGTWDRSGSLGWTPANAWTSMPGENPVGAILEKPVGTFSNIIAHELGHYLNLDHVSDEGDLMNPVIYDNSTTLTAYQCSAARDAAQNYWRDMIRT